MVVYPMNNDSKLQQESSLIPPVVGSVLNAYIVCPRKAWLMSRQICPDEDNTYLYLGRLIQNQYYSRERKEIFLEHLCLDLIRKEDETLVVAEVKKSSRAREAARMQLAFYLYELKQMEISAKGELLFPEERRKEQLVLDKKLEQQVEEIKNCIVELVLQDQPPPPERSGFCRNCAYTEFCWA